MLQLWDRIRDWVILLALLGSAVVVMTVHNAPLVRSLRAVSLDLTGRIETRFVWLGAYMRALDENDELRTENVQLAGDVARSREAVQENERLKAMLALRDSSSVPLRTARILTKSLVPARIVSRDPTKQQNLLTLNVGRVDSVDVGMGVIDTDGIVGKVVLVSEHFSRVMPILNTEFRTPGAVQPLGAEGIVRWEGNDLDQLLMEHIVKTEPVEPGMRVVTSGHSGIFPSGYAIGTVDSVRTRPGRNELIVHLRPAARVTQADYVFVILKRPSAEQQALEAQPVR